MYIVWCGISVPKFLYFVILEIAGRNDFQLYIKRIVRWNALKLSSEHSHVAICFNRFMITSSNMLSAIIDPRCLTSRSIHVFTSVILSSGIIYTMRAIFKRFTAHVIAYEYRVDWRCKITGSCKLHAVRNFHLVQRGLPRIVYTCYM